MEKNLKLGRKIEGLHLVLCNCDQCPDTLSALRVLANVIRFVDPRPDNPNRPELHPERRPTESDGSIIVPITIIHPALGRDCKYFSVGWKVGVASLYYLADTKSVIISQTNSPGAETLEEMATGLVNLAKEVAPAIGASYGWVDVETSKPRPSKITRFGQVKHWFFANVFGPVLVQSASDGFFADCPAQEHTPLANDGQLLTAASTFADWFLSPSKDLAKYLDQHAPKISIFRP